MLSAMRAIISQVISTPMSFSSILQSSSMASDTHWHPARYLYSFGDSSDENASDGSPAEALYAVIILNCTVEEPNTFIDIYERGLEESIPHWLV